MKLRYEFVLTNVAGIAVATAVGKDFESFRGMIELNETGEFLFRLLKNEIMYRELVLQLCAACPDVKPSQIEADVSAFLQMLRSRDILLE